MNGSRFRGINLILWDIGGVLQFQYEEAFLVEIAQKVGADYEALLGMRRRKELDLGRITERDYLMVFSGCFGVPLDELQERYDRYFDLAIDESLTILRQLRCVEHAILSNHYHRAWEWLEMHNILDVIPRSRIFLSCDIGFAKPDLRAYEIVLTNLQKSGEEIAFLDNMARNLAPAANLGMHTIEFQSPGQAKNELARLGLTSIRIRS